MELNRRKDGKHDYKSKDSLFSMEKDPLSIHNYPKNSKSKFYKGAETYDYVAARGECINFPMDSVCHLLHCCISGGIFSIHEAFMICGIWLALILTICLGIVMCYCNWMLINSARRTYGRVKTPTLSYGGLFEASMKLSPWPCMRRIAPCIRCCIELKMALHMFTTNLIMTILVARSIKCLNELTVTLEPNVDLLPYILPQFLLNVVFSALASVNFLAPMIVVADSYIVLISIFSLYSGLQMEEGVELETLPFWTGFPEIYRFLSLAVFAFNNINITLDVESNMTEPSKFKYVNMITSTILTTCLGFVGFFGYWAFGKTCITPIVIQFPYRLSVMIVKVFIIIILLSQYITNFSMGFSYLWCNLKKLYRPANYWFWKRVNMVMCMVVITGTACGYNDVLTIMALLGSLVITPFVFIYPAIIQTLVYWKHPGLGPYRWILVKNIAMVTFGASVVVCGTTFTIMSVVNKV